MHISRLLYEAVCITASAASIWKVVKVYKLLYLPSPRGWQHWTSEGSFVALLSQVRGQLGLKHARKWINHHKCFDIAWLHSHNCYPTLLIISLSVNSLLSGCILATIESRSSWHYSGTIFLLHGVFSVFYSNNIHSCFRAINVVILRDMTRHNILLYLSNWSSYEGRRTLSNALSSSSKTNLAK